MEFWVLEMLMLILFIDEREGEDFRSDDVGGLRKEMIIKIWGGLEVLIFMVYW